MPKGGARVNSGPPPDPNALRRDRAQDKDGWTLLPAEGRTSSAPDWPLRTHEDMALDAVSDDSGRLMEFAMARDAREQGVWADLWASPQAVAWDRMGWSGDVALYARFLVLAERGDLKAAGEARQWSDRLGLNPAAMLRNRWRVVSDEVSKKREDRSATTAARSSSRSRLQAVPGGGD